MIRAILAVAILLIGIAIGSCLSLSRGAVRPNRQDWRPVPGVRYERPGARTRTVLEVWQKGVRYRYDNGHERSCATGTWKRWATTKGGGD